MELWLGQRLSGQGMEKTGGKNRLFMSPESAWQGNVERRWRTAMEVGSWPGKAGLDKRHASLPQLSPLCTDRTQNPLELWPE